MTRRTIEEESVRNLQKSRSSYFVIIPVEIIREFGWQERQKVVVEKAGKQEIRIKDWSR